MRKFLAFPLLPLIITIIIFVIAFFWKQWGNPLVAAGTVGAVVTAVGAIYYREIKIIGDRPILEMGEPGFKPPFYRRAPEIIQTEVVGIGYYINILLKNTGKRTAKNCQPILTMLWKFIQGNWQKEENWISVALLWGAGEHEIYEYGIRKPREERNLIPNRPYYLSLGRITTQDPKTFELMQVIILTAQNNKFEPGEYCFEVTVNGEDIDPPVKYFKVRWDGGCTEDLNEVEGRFFVSMHDDAPCKN